MRATNCWAKFFEPKEYRPEGKKPTPSATHGRRNKRTNERTNERKPGKQVRRKERKKEGKSDGVFRSITSNKVVLASQNKRVGGGLFAFLPFATLARAVADSLGSSSTPSLRLGYIQREHACAHVRCLLFPPTVDVDGGRGMRGDLHGRLRWETRLAF